MKAMLNKVKDTVWYGLLIGLLIPGVLSLIAWFLIHTIKVMATADILYIGCIATNAWWMQYFFKRDKDAVGKGVLSATFICAFVFYFYKVL